MLVMLNKSPQDQLRSHAPRRQHRGAVTLNFELYRTGRLSDFRRIMFAARSAVYLGAPPSPPLHLFGLRNTSWIVRHHVVNRPQSWTWAWLMAQACKEKCTKNFNRKYFFSNLQTAFIFFPKKKLYRYLEVCHSWSEFFFRISSPSIPRQVGGVQI